MGPGATLVTKPIKAAVAHYCSWFQLRTWRAPGHLSNPSYEGSALWSQADLTFEEGVGARSDPLMLNTIHKHTCI